MLLQQEILLLAGSNRQPIGVFDTPEKLWEAVLKLAGVPQRRFTTLHAVRDCGDSVPCTYEALCRRLQDKTTTRRAIVYDRDNKVVYRIWELPVNPDLNKPTATYVDKLFFT